MGGAGELQHRAELRKVRAQLVIDALHLEAHGGEELERHILEDERSVN